MFKRLWTIILTVALALAALVPGQGLALVAIPPEARLVTVGTPTPVSGYFYSDMWGNNATDIDIRDMLHGYRTVYLNQKGQLTLDESVVASLDTADGAEGRTYTFTLLPGATYNDGTAITAADYVFTILLQSAPAIASLGGNNALFSYLLGYGAYASGSTPVFQGVRLLSDTRFSLTVPSDALPYYYESSYLNVAPSPLSVIAPGYAVKDDGNGAYLTDTLSETLLRETLLSDAGYLHRPMVTCGPYQLASYEAATHTVTLTANAAYRGDHAGQKPTLLNIRVIPLPDEEAISAFQSGKVQIVNKLSVASVINQAMPLRDELNASLTAYARSGFAFLAFACEDEPTDNPVVRQALSLCVNRDLLCATLLEGYALPVYGYYGIGQWMVAQAMPELEKYKERSYDVNAARTLLQKSGYVYNAEGKKFNAQADDVRYKKGENGVLIALELRWAKTPGDIPDELERLLTPIMQTLGIRLTVTEVSFEAMLSDYYRENGGKRRYNLYFLGTNFRQTFDPYYTYHTEDVWQGAFNTSGLRSKRLMEKARELRSVTAGDTETYLTRWVAFQDAWREEMPLIPIYSNVYFDLCASEITGYTPSSYVGFGMALLYASVTQE